jgi:hypothetical protein
MRKSTHGAIGHATPVVEDLLELGDGCAPVPLHQIRLTTKIDRI